MAVPPSANLMTAQATNYDVSVEIAAKSHDINLEISNDDNLGFNSEARANGWDRLTGDHPKHLELS